MIRILHVVTHMNRGGLETMLMNYYRAIDRDKVQFDFLVHRYEIGDYDGEIERLGGKIFRLPILNPFSKRYKNTLYDFFERHPEYKVIHVHQDCMSSVILKSAKRAGIPVRIAHSHSSSQDKNIKYPIKLFFKQSIGKYATELFACGKEAGDWMFNGAPYRIINNAIDAKKYKYSSIIRSSMRCSLDIEDNEIVVGHVGRFSPPKNHEFLITVFNEIYKKNKNVKLLLVGDYSGSIGEKIQERIQSLRLTKNVILTGVRSDVADLMQAMDVFVFPSIYEGLPLTLIEAQANGLSCLISDKVPIECKKTEDVTQISLNESPERWAEIALLLSENKRSDNLESIKKTGFDITENAFWLQEFYISKFKRGY